MGETNPETYLDTSQEQPLLTYYEISLEDQEPFTGSLTYEHTDLREALNQVQRGKPSRRKIEMAVRIPRSQVERLFQNKIPSSDKAVEFRLIFLQEDFTDSPTLLEFEFKT